MRLITGNVNALYKRDPARARLLTRVFVQLHAVQQQQTFQQFILRYGAAAAAAAAAGINLPNSTQGWIHFVSFRPLARSFEPTLGAGAACMPFVCNQVFVGLT